MNDFIEFYSNGAFFNHVVTLFCLGALTSVAMHLAGPRAQGEQHLLRLAERFVAIGVATGALGVLFNVIEMSVALSSIAPEHATPATHRALSIVPIPLIWALMCAIPVWVTTTCLRHRALVHA